jgi:hypothetical protein
MRRVFRRRETLDLCFQPLSDNDFVALQFNRPMAGGFGSGRLIGAATEN